MSLLQELIHKCYNDSDPVVNLLFYFRNCVPLLQELIHKCYNDSDPVVKLHTAKVRRILQGSFRLEKYLNLECFLEKYLKIKSALKSTGKSLEDLESLNSSIFCRT